MEDGHFDVAVIGGGCAGLTAGLYAARAGLRTVVLEGLANGGQAAVTHQIDNYPGLPHAQGAQLAQAMAEQAAAFGALLRSARVEEVALPGRVKTLTAGGAALSARALILATGATPRQAGFRGEEDFRGRGVSYCATCDGFFFRGLEVLVVGGGTSAAQEALFLTRFASAVTLLVRGEALRCPAPLAEQVLAHPAIRVRFHTVLQEISGHAAPEEAVLLDRATGLAAPWRPARGGRFGVFVFAGLTPATGLFRGQLPLDSRGYILADESTRTGLPGVFAAGDVRVKPLRQVVTAAADGAVAAAGAADYLSHPRG